MGCFGPENVPSLRKPRSNQSMGWSYLSCKKLSPMLRKRKWRKEWILKRRSFKVNNCKATGLAKWNYLPRKSNETQSVESNSSIVFCPLSLLFSVLNDGSDGVLDATIIFVGREVPGRQRYLSREAVKEVSDNIMLGISNQGMLCSTQHRQNATLTNPVLLSLTSSIRSICQYAWDLAQIASDTVQSKSLNLSKY